jgi:ribosome-binding factor A
MQTESPRQQKIAAVLQKELATLLQTAIRRQGTPNLLVSITKVKVTVDLAQAKVYLSFFPKEKTAQHLAALQENQVQLRHDLGQLLRHQLRRIPELMFFIDDSLDYIEAIDKALKRTENPIQSGATPPKKS